MSDWYVDYVNRGSQYVQRGIDWVAEKLRRNPEQPPEPVVYTPVVQPPPSIDAAGDHIDRVASPALVTPSDPVVLPTLVASSPPKEEPKEEPVSASLVQPAEGSSRKAARGKVRTTPQEQVFTRPTGRRRRIHDLPPPSRFGEQFTGKPTIQVERDGQVIHDDRSIAYVFPGDQVRVSFTRKTDAEEVPVSIQFVRRDSQREEPFLSPESIGTQRVQQGEETTVTDYAVITIPEEAERTIWYTLVTDVENNGGVINPNTFWVVDSCEALAYEEQRERCASSLAQLREPEITEPRQTVAARVEPLIPYDATTYTGPFSGTVLSRTQLWEIQKIQQRGPWSVKEICDAYGISGGEALDISSAPLVSRYPISEDRLASIIRVAKERGITFSARYHGLQIPVVEDILENQELNLA